MKKNTFYALLFCMTLLTCAVESIGDNSAEIEQAQTKSVQTMYEESERPATDTEIVDDYLKYNPNATEAEISEILTPKQRY